MRTVKKNKKTKTNYREYLEFKKYLHLGWQAVFLFNLAETNNTQEGGWQWIKYLCQIYKRNEWKKYRQKQEDFFLYMWRWIYSLYWLKRNKTWEIHKCQRINHISTKASIYKQGQNWRATDAGSSLKMSDKTPRIKHEPSNLFIFLSWNDFMWPKCRVPMNRINIFKPDTERSNMPVVMLMRTHALILFSHSVIDSTSLQPWEKLPAEHLLQVFCFYSII